MYNGGHQSIEYNFHTWLLSIQHPLIHDCETCIRFLSILLASAFESKHSHRAGSGYIKAVGRAWRVSPVRRGSSEGFAAALTLPETMSALSSRRLLRGSMISRLLKAVRSVAEAGNGASLCVTSG